MQREQNHCHAGEDEVAEGDVHSRLATPVSRRYQTGDAQGGTAFDLRKKPKRQIESKQVSDIYRLVNKFSSHFCETRKDTRRHKTQKPSHCHNKHLSVLCVVHCKVGWHSSCQHSQYDGLYVHQRVGSRIGNLLKGCDNLKGLSSF